MKETDVPADQPRISAHDHARAEAEALALLALGYLGETDDLLSVFLAASGLTPEDLRARIEDSELHAAVLDFVLMDDAWVLGFASAAGLRPERIAIARRALPGADLPHWT